LQQHRAFFNDFTKISTIFNFTMQGGKKSYCGGQNDSKFTIRGDAKFTIDICGKKTENKKKNVNLYRHFGSLVEKDELAVGMNTHN
jgi:hypothetical protein